MRQHTDTSWWTAARMSTTSAFVSVYRQRDSDAEPTKANKQTNALREIGQQSLSGPSSNASNDGHSWKLERGPASALLLEQTKWSGLDWNTPSHLHLVSSFLYRNQA
mmetsp:Transcript_22158/g.61677  ORF Transcript_22158/g.61677 Transcript_22158/m.61677 type:complete len:107 (-) Transcript_22158:71-391(-)